MKLLRFSQFPGKLGKPELAKSPSEKPSSGFPNFLTQDWENLRMPKHLVNLLSQVFPVSGETGKTCNHPKPFYIPVFLYSRPPIDSRIPVFLDFCVRVNLHFYTHVFLYTRGSIFLLSLISIFLCFCIFPLKFLLFLRVSVLLYSYVIYLCVSI